MIILVQVPNNATSSEKYYTVRRLFMYMYVEKCMSTWAVQAVYLQTLYIAYFKLEEMNSHGKCVASPRLTTPSQCSVTGSGQLHGKLSVLTRSYDTAVQMMPCIALVHTKVTHG